MTNRDVYQQALAKFRAHYRTDPTVAGYAPGRVEVLGNHTDYNDGFVLSAAIDFGTFFLAAPSGDMTCRVLAGDLDKEVSFPAAHPAPSPDDMWCNYIKGVYAKLGEQGPIDSGFLGVFLGNVPLGAGLSSSAALEMAAGLALCELYSIQIDRHALALVGQAAEHEFVGAKCGLLDQISSLHGKEHELIMIDFRTFEIRHLPMGKDACFLMCNTNVTHSLVDSEYNERRENCEKSAVFFDSVLDRPVSALRDVTWDDWTAHKDQMDPVAAQRAAHVIGENDRVLKGCDLLASGNLEKFGSLMFASHRSSRENFENSCPELDFLVDAAAAIPGVMGARLSGGGFGGSAVILIHPRDKPVVTKALGAAYTREYDVPCDIRGIVPSAGAQLLRLTSNSSSGSLLTQ